MAVSRPNFEPLPVEPLPAHVTVARVGNRRWLWGVVAIAGIAIVYWLARGTSASREAPSAAARGAARSVPVVAVAARSGDLPISLSGLGSVTAFNTVTVRSRVDGQLMKVAFQEGQLVKQGDLLAEIDPRTFQAQLAQAEGQLARDQAQLHDAQTNLARYKELLAKQFISKQQYDDQASTVGQFAGAVKADQGSIAAAKVQLDYARIAAPIGGRVGLRLVDAGNMVHAADTSGIVVITQVQPISVLFTIPEDHLPAVMKALASGTHLGVEAYDRSGRTKIADGELTTADNQIDPTTGTFRLKAVFPNDDFALFPNQFVNVRLLLDVQKGATLVPTTAIQRGPNGTFVYVVKADHTVEMRPITVGVTAGDQAAIASGLAPGDLAVVDGADKLRTGTAVEVREPTKPAAPAAGA